MRFGFNSAKAKHIQIVIAPLASLSPLQGEGITGDYAVGADGTVERVVTVPKALDPATLEKVRKSACTYVYVSAELVFKDPWV